MNALIILKYILLFNNINIAHETGIIRNAEKDKMASA